MRALDLIGQRFGRLVAVELAAPQGRRRRWRCACDCGGQVVVLAENLRSEHSRSCGCLRTEERGAIRRRTPKEVSSCAPAEFSIWKGMRQRCGNPRNARFADYGGRGISVCSRWENSFESFLSDVGHRPSPAHSLDRIENDGNYEPGNVRWATDREQAINTSRNRLVTVDEVTLTMTEWSEKIGVPLTTLYGRIASGLSPADAVKLGRTDRAKR